MIYSGTLRRLRGLLDAGEPQMGLNDNIHRFEKATLQQTSSGSLHLSFSTLIQASFSPGCGTLAASSLSRTPSSRYPFLVVSNHFDRFV